MQKIYIFIKAILLFDTYKYLIFENSILLTIIYSKMILNIIKILFKMQDNLSNQRKQFPLSQSFPHRQNKLVFQTMRSKN